MPPGPLPKPNARRRNAPTIPTTDLPASGRKGAAPAEPSGYEFGEDARAWWSWAWKTPQAAGWSKGDLYTVARRAVLEDDLAALRRVETDDFDLAEMLGDEDGEALRYLISRLKSLATGELQIGKEARELDDRLGLTPKGMAALRWKIVDDSAQAKSRSTKRTSGPRLKAVK